MIVAGNCNITYYVTLVAVKTSNWKSRIILVWNSHGVVLISGFRGLEVDSEAFNWRIRLGAPEGASSSRPNLPLLFLPRVGYTEELIFLIKYSLVIFSRIKFIGVTVYTIFFFQSGQAYARCWNFFPKSHWQVRIISFGDEISLSWKTFFESKRFIPRDGGQKGW